MAGIDLHCVHDTVCAQLLEYLDAGTRDVFAYGLQAFGLISRWLGIRGLTR